MPHGTPDCSIGAGKEVMAFFVPCGPENHTLRKNTLRKKDSTYMLQLDSKHTIENTKDTLSTHTLSTHTQHTH